MSARDRDDAAGAAAAMVMLAVALLVLLIALALAFAAPAGAQVIVPQQVILYKNAAQPALEQRQQKWLTPAAAYTAITVPAQFDVLKANGAQLQLAWVQVVWAAHSAGSYSGAGIFVCPAQPHAGVDLIGCSALAYFAADDRGPAPYTPGCITNPGGPFPCGADVTAAMQAHVEAGLPGLYFVGVAFGNGVSGPLIYDLEIFINWLAGSPREPAPALVSARCATFSARCR